MAKGDRLPAEWQEFEDATTGVRARQLTSYKGHSNHLYFTNPGWHDGGRRLLFGSERCNCSNLYSIELASGAITQLTGYGPDAPASSFQNACLSPARAEAYYWQRRELIALDLGTLEERTLYEAPAGFTTSIANVTADGAAVCSVISEDLSGRIRMDLAHGYVGFEEYWAARPLSRVLRVPVGGGAAEVACEERSWIGHINTSPTQPRWRMTAYSAA